MCAVEGDPCLRTACIDLFLVTRSMCPCVSATIAKVTIIRDQVMGARILTPGRNIVPEIFRDRYVWPEQPLAHNTFHKVQTGAIFPEECRVPDTVFAAIWQEKRNLRASILGPA